MLRSQRTSRVRAFAAAVCAVVVGLGTAACFKDPHEGLVTSLPPQTPFSTATTVPSSADAPFTSGGPATSSLPSAPATTTSAPATIGGTSADPGGPSSTQSAPASMTAITLTVATSGVTGAVTPPSATPPPAEHTPAGAARFAEWYDGLSAVAYEQKSTMLLKQYSAEKCLSCKELIATIERTLASGDTVRYGPKSVQTIQSNALNERYAAVVIFRNSAGYTELDPTGNIVERTDPSVKVVGLILYWNGENWITSYALPVIEK